MRGLLLTMNGVWSMTNGKWRVGTRVPREHASDATFIKIATYDESQVAIHGGGGNCTRSSFDESCFSQTVCENCPTGMSEECRDDATIRELVASWHRLTPDVRAAVMQLVRGRG